MNHITPQSGIPTNLKRLPWVDRLKQQLSKLMDALADGAPVHSVKDRMAELEGRKLKLMAELEQAEQPAPRLFPNMGQLYRERVAELIDELQADESEGLRTRLRSLVDEVRLVPEGDDLRVEVRGALAGILHLATGGAGLDGAGMTSAGAVAQGVVMPSESENVLGMFGLQIKMDAGTGYQRSQYIEVAI
jgi:site-specific DNA recombinase